MYFIKVKYKNSEGLEQETVLDFEAAKSFMYQMDMKKIQTTFALDVPEVESIYN